MKSNQRCIALLSTRSGVTLAVSCQRRADWEASYCGGGRAWYCRYHVASRKTDPALKNWRRIP